MMRHSDGRSGFALMISLIAVLITGALMLSALYYGAGDVRAGHLATIRNSVFVASETALWSALSGTSARTIRALPIGASIRSGSTRDNLSTVVIVTRVDTSFVWIVATATALSGRDAARHRLGLSAIAPRDTNDQQLQRVPNRAWSELF